jgi:hypothetical protein
MTPTEAIAEMRKIGAAATHGPARVTKTREHAHVVERQMENDERGGPEPLSDFDGYVPVAEEMSYEDAHHYAAMCNLFPLLLAAVEAALVALANAQRIDERFFYGINAKKADIESLDAALSALARKVEEMAKERREA